MYCSIFTKLLSITKLQNLKAIHNSGRVVSFKPLLLSITKLQNLKAIHNSYSFYCFFYLVVINHKTTKFESNSQLTHSCLLGRGGCYQSQNYKIWKQFTTIILHRHQGSGLLSIAKLQNLKSNSQLLVIGVTYLKSCYQSQNYKIWKQFTT